MLTSLFNFIIKIFFWICGLLGSIIIYPIQLLIVTIFPSIGELISTTLTFFNNQFFPFLSFAKEMFLDLTCLPRPIFSILLTFLLTKWAIAPAIRSLIFVINMYRLMRGGMTISLSHGSKYVKY